MTRARFDRMSNRSRGAALVVALVLLLALTVLAISSMNTASLELVMAGNTQYQQNAFQAAEAGIEQALRAGQFNPGSGPERLPADASQTIPIPGTNNQDSFAATITSQLSGSPQPAMWGSSWNSFSTYHFEIESIGRSTRNAIARNYQGVAVIAPFDEQTQMPIDPSNTELTP
jgi:Tfp pilus assembly protein PilX